MDYEKRLSTLKDLFASLTKKLREETIANLNPAKVQECKFHLQQIETEISRIAKMRSYKK
jgi:hypothetical protein